MSAHTGLCTGVARRGHRAEDLDKRERLVGSEWATSA